MSEETDNGWMRYPEAKVRMRDNGLKLILEGLGHEGYCHASTPKFHLLDDGIYVDILLNVGKHGSIVALSFEVFIPISEADKKLDKKAAKAIAKAAKKAAKRAAEDEAALNQVKEPIDETEPN